MRAIAISVGVATLIFLVTGGRLILIPLLMLPLSLFALRRVREYVPAMTRPLDPRRRRS